MVAFEMSERWDKHMQEVMKDDEVILLDGSGNIVSWNKEQERIKGYTADEIMGQHFRIFFMPGDRQSMLPERLLEKARQEGTAKQIGQRVRKDGTIFWSNMLITALQDETVNVVGFFTLTRELSDSKA